MIKMDPQSPTEVLMEALEVVEGAQKVVILIEKEDSISIRTNCDYRELKWALDQAIHATMNELFGVRMESD